MPSIISGFLFSAQLCYNDSMQDKSFIRKMMLLGILLVVVLGIFFLQQRPLLTSGPQPTPTPIAAASGNIQISAPLYEGSVGPNFLVQGQARVPGNIIMIRLSNKIRGTIYYENATQVYPPEEGAPGAFTTVVNMNTNDLALRPNDRLTLEVFHTENNAERDMVIIPLYFSPELP